MYDKNCKWHRDCGYDFCHGEGVCPDFEKKKQKSKKIEAAEETAPEIDAVPVVRCKDCQYWEYDHNYDSTIAFGYCRCRDWQTPWSESEIETVGMGYCHHGVRRED